MSLKHLVYNVETNTCENIILYDGVSEFDPGAGKALEIIPAGSSAWIGWTRISEGNWEEPVAVIEEAVAE
jgi:hypothetical protein